MFFENVGSIDVQNVGPAAKKKQQKHGSFVQFVLDEMMAISPDTLNPFAPPPSCFLILTGGKSKTISPPRRQSALYVCIPPPLDVVCTLLSSLAERDRRCSLVDGCSTLIRY